MSETTQTASSCGCDSPSGQTSAAQASPDTQISLSAALASDGGDLDASVVASHDLLGTSSDAAIDVGVDTQLASLGLSDGMMKSAALFSDPGTDTGLGAQVALAADVPDIGAVPTSFGILGGEPLSLSSLDIPTVDVPDLCSLGSLV